MNIFNKLFRKNTGVFVKAQLNDKLEPIDRGTIYEEPLDEFLRSNKYGEVTGGGTLMAKTGEIIYCDLEILIYHKQDVEMIIKEIIKILELHGAPKGSLISAKKKLPEISFGKKEGLAIFIDGVNLPENIYKECDINYVLQELGKLIGSSGNVVRCWEGETETALYFYGESYEEMNNSISEFIKEYPLCQGARIVQIA